MSRYFFLGMLLCVLPLRTYGEGNMVCRWVHSIAAPPDGMPPSGRQYAPNRQVDVLHLAIDVTPDWKARSIEGKVNLRIRPLLEPLHELKLDGVDLRVQSVASSETVAGWQNTEEHVVITFAQPVPVEKETTVTITYAAEPKKGLYFRTPEMGYKAEDAHIWTQGEPSEARHWYPSYDYPNDKFTSEVTCRVPEGMEVLSNGKLVSQEKDGESGLVAVRWVQEKPHANYLICLVAGHIKKIEDKYREIPLAFYTPASEIQWASNSFAGTKDMMEYFEKEIGVPYPWSKYYQACVHDFGWGGMENTSLTVLNNSTLFTPEFETTRSSQGLVAHELAHQWFGDLVTCKDWANIWLNEGFATYYAALYDGHKNGRDELLLEMYSTAKSIISQPNQTNAIVRRDYRDPEELFNYLAYPKGAWVLHMLRTQLGEEVFRRCVKTYLERHQFGNATTEDLRKVIEEISGRSFDQFFDQWVYHAAHPELNITYTWDEKTKTAKLNIQQTQKLSDDVLLFHFPLPVRFATKSGVVNRQIVVREKAEDFYFPLSEAPELVRIDPDVTVLAKVTFNQPTPMLHRQLASKDDAVGRIIAAESLDNKKDRETVGKLQQALNNDPFYGVRIAASRALRSIHTEEAFKALLASTKQSEARVRRQVVSDIGSFYRQESYEALARLLPDEKNPDIQAAAVGGLSSYPKPEMREMLLKRLEMKSFRNISAESSLNAIRAQDDSTYLPKVMQALQQREGEFTTHGFARGLETVGWLARHEQDKSQARDFLLKHLESKRQRIQVAAISALGVLDDPKAAPALEKLASGPKDGPQRTAADRALAAIRDGKKPGTELGAVRNEILSLQRENRELRKELDDLKKRLDSLAPKALSTNAPKTAKTSEKTEKPARKTTTRSPFDR